MNAIARNLALLLILAGFVASSAAQDAPALPVYEQDPYDQVVVDEANGGGTYKVLPLDLPDRKLPQDPPPTALLTVRLVNQPDVSAQIAWKHIAKIELFEQLVLGEAKRLIEAQQFEAAYDHLDFLHLNYANLPGLAEAANELRYRNAAAQFKRGRHAEALALLEAVYREEPQRAGLAAALANVSQPLFDASVRDQRYAAARALIERTAQRGDEAALQLSQSWHEELATEARAQEKLARGLLQAEDFRKANVAAQQMLAIWPEIPGGRALASEVARHWPMVRVGVTDAVPVDACGSEFGRSARRIATLSQQALVQLTGFGPDGAEFASPVGRVTASDNRRSLAVVTDRLTGYEISAALLAACDPRHASYDPVLSSLMKVVRVVDVHRTEVDLQRAYPQPLAALSRLQLDRRYAAVASSPQRVEYLLRNEQIGPREVVETTFATPAAALAELRRGTLDVVELIDPRDVMALADDGSLRIGRYAVPRVHVLIPNSHRALPANGTFRRAIAYGLPRTRILQQDVLAGSDAVHGRVISGPFPMGTAQEPWADAYDRTIEPLAYEPRMALTLWRAAQSEASRGSKATSEKVTTSQPIVIGHGGDALHRRACLAMAESLTRIGMSCQPRDLASSDAQAVQECDFWYAELAIEEPLVDAPRMFGHGGIAQPSSHVLLAAGDVIHAANNQQASQRLFALHRLVHAEQAVIPLWQTTGYYAYRPALDGLGETTISLYTNIDKWRVNVDAIATTEKH